MVKCFPIDTTRQTAGNFSAAQRLRVREDRINYTGIAIPGWLRFVYTFLWNVINRRRARYAAVQRSYRINESDECACCPIDSPFAVTFLDIGQRSGNGERLAEWKKESDAFELARKTTRRRSLSQPGPFVKLIATPASRQSINYSANRHRGRREEGDNCGVERGESTLVQIPMFRQPGLIIRRRFNRDTRIGKFGFHRFSRHSRVFIRSVAVSARVARGET